MKTNSITLVFYHSQAEKTNCWTQLFFRFVSSSLYYLHGVTYCWDILQFNLKKSLDLKKPRINFRTYCTWTRKMLELPHWTRIDFTIYWRSTWKILRLDFIIYWLWTWKTLGLKYWTQIYFIIINQGCR